MNFSLEHLYSIGESLFLCSLLLVLLSAYGLLKNYFSKLPPGPWGLPIIGACFRISKNAHLDFTNMAKQYGDIFSLMLGNRLVVVINGVEAIQETIIRQSIAFAGRPNLHSFQKANPYGSSLVLSDYSPQWRISRKISTSAIQNFARNTDVLSEQLLVESQRLVQYLSQQTNKPLDPSKTFKCASANIILHALFGVGRPYDDEDLQKIFEITEHYGKAIEGSAYIDFLPLLKYLPNKLLTSLTVLMKSLHDEINKMFLKNEASYIDGRIRNIADSFISIVKKEPENEKEKTETGWKTTSTAPLLSDREIVAVLADLFGGAIDTSTVSMQWSLAYLIKYPDIQQQLHDELDRVIGRERLPTLQDIPSLPLLQATVYELLRVTSTAATAIPHSTTADVNVREFIIPKDTLVFINLWSVHRNPEIWKDPDVFNPRRFLNNEGQVIDPKSLGGFMPFSVGRRQCPGQALAMKQLQVFLAVLLHSFHFTQDGLPAKYQGINLQGERKLSLQPEKFFVKLEERSSLKFNTES